MGKGGAKIIKARLLPQDVQMTESIVMGTEVAAVRRRQIDVYCHFVSAKNRQGLQSVCYLTFSFFA
jgi:hypothetical protein